MDPNTLLVAVEFDVAASELDMAVGDLNLVVGGRHPTGLDVTVGTSI
jgi:hypothetical protein